MRGFRYIAAVLGTLLLTGVGFCAWLMHGFHESMKTDYWRRDGKPDAEVAKRLADCGYPSTISRTAEAGYSSRANGDGERVTIYCFPPTDVERMKNLLGGRSWVVGLPSGDDWRSSLQEHAPADLLIPSTAKTSDYIHVPSDPKNHNWNWTIIDVVRGISYEFFHHR